MSCGNQVSPNYPNIFDPANCSLISQLLPATQKQFLFDFMNGNAFRNPIAQVTGLLQNKIGANLNTIAGITSLSGDLAGLNAALSNANGQMDAFAAHTNRLSGLSKDGGASLDQILGVMSAYNSIKDLLKNSGDCLEDNFSRAFSSLDPQINGPFFENFGQNMNQISGVLSEIQNQLAMGGATDLADLFGQLATLTANVSALTSNVQALMQGDNDAFALALAFIERYALGNSLISTALIDPCFGAQLIKNLITTPSASQQLDGIAKESGVVIDGSPVNMLNSVPSLKIDM
jgi:hypothetical protein